MWEAYEYWKRVAETLKGHNSSRTVIPYPKSFREFSPADLLNNTAIFASLIRCYQQVFGGRDIWGEGAKCNKCGEQIAIEEFIERKAKRNYICDKCGGTFVQIFPANFLRERILQELDPKLYAHPFIILYLNDTLDEVLGFCWGVVDKPGKIAERIIKNKYADDTVTAGLVREKLLESFNPEEMVVYYDEIGILREARGGLGSVVSLVRLGLEKGCENAAQKALYWTARKSPIYTICRLSGYEDLFEAPGNLVFCYSEDFLPLLMAIQYFSSEEQTSMVAEVAKEILKS